MDKKIYNIIHSLYTHLGNKKEEPMVEFLINGTTKFSVRLYLIDDDLLYSQEQGIKQLIYNELVELLSGQSTSIKQLIYNRLTEFLRQAKLNTLING